MGTKVSYTLDEVRVAAKREPFRAGVRMRYVMPRISVRVTQRLLNHAPAVTPNQVTVVSCALGIAAGLLLLSPRGLGFAIAAFFVYQLHILLDYVDGELARVKRMESALGAYYDLMVGRLTKPVVIYSAVIGTWLGHRRSPGAAADLILGTLIVIGFFLDKEAVDVWYRANAGSTETEIEDRYVIRSERSLGGRFRVALRTIVGLRGIQAFLVYQILAAAVSRLGLHEVTLLTYHTTPRGAVLIGFAVAFPTLALARSIYISRTGHVPRRQDLVLQR